MFSGLIRLSQGYRTFGLSSPRPVRLRTSELTYRAEPHRFGRSS